VKETRERELESGGKKRRVRIRAAREKEGEERKAGE
jgi:hypothetical protein